MNEDLIWTKKDCPLCGKEGKLWQNNKMGGYSWVKCDHTMPGKVIEDRINNLKQEIKEKQESVDNYINNWINKSKEK